MEKDLRSAFNTRQYLLRSDYEIFFYSDRTISGILDHAHDFYEFYLLLSGDVSMAVDETEYRIAPGSLILIRPGQKHRLINHDLEVPYARYVFWISADCYSGLCGEYPDLGFAMSWAKTTGCCVFPLTLAQFGDVRAAVTALIRETRTEHFGKKTGEAIQMRRLLLSVSRAVYEQSVAGRDIAADENLVDKAISSVEENLDRDLSGDCMVIGTSAIVDTELDGAVGMNSGIFNNPFLIWGRYRKKGFRYYLPVSFQFHHTQMDGAHAARFLEHLQDEINMLAK